MHGKEAVQGGAPPYMDNLIGRASSGGTNSALSKPQCPNGFFALSPSLITQTLALTCCNLKRLSHPNSNTPSNVLQKKLLEPEAARNSKELPERHQVTNKPTNHRRASPSNVTQGPHQQPWGFPTRKGKRNRRSTYLKCK